ncbi:bile acid:sodium symporter family protein, partial [Acinetobacter variabilis]
ALTCSFEITIHNTALAITVALSVLGNTAMAIPAGIYSIFMFVYQYFYRNFAKRKNTCNFYVS